MSDCTEGTKKASAFATDTSPALTDKVMWVDPVAGQMFILTIAEFFENLGITVFKLTTGKTIKLDGESIADTFIIQSDDATDTLDINNTAIGGNVRLFATEDIEFRTGTLDPAFKIFKSGGMVANVATGGDQGAGTINAQGVFDDGVLLTCYVFKAATGQELDDILWDSKAVDREYPEVKDTDGKVIQQAYTEERTHEGYHKFKERIGSQYDPLDIDKYAAHWKDKEHLTAMPNEANFNPEEPMSTGNWIQRLIETVEIQAVHIEQLNQRIKALEA